MPLCGFNQKMLEGLIAFHEGLVEHGLVDRSTKKNQSVEQTLQNELRDMDRFLEETHRIDNPQMKELVEALTAYSRAFYQLIGKQGHDNYKQVIQGLNGFYRNMDGKFYSELEGQKDDMGQLVEYLNSQKI